jgi:hypothetical protein
LVRADEVGMDAEGWVDGCELGHCFYLICLYE